MNKLAWLLCPVCGNKTRLRVRGDTQGINFPLHCSKCKQETLANIRKRNLSVIQMGNQISKEEPLR